MKKISVSFFFILFFAFLIISPKEVLAAAPVFNYIPDNWGNHVAYPGEQFQLNVKATDPGGGAVTYTDPTLPTGATINQGTRILSWTPSAGDSGNQFALTFKAADGSNNITTAISTIVVVEKKPAADICSGMPPVGSQSGQSCVSWALGYYQRTFEEGKKRGWDVTNPAHICSPGYIYSFNQTPDGSTGMMSGIAFNAMKKTGCAPVSTKGTSDFSEPTLSQYEDALPMKITSSGNVNDPSASAKRANQLQTVRDYIKSGHAPEGAFMTYSNWYSTNGGNGVYDGPRGSGSVGSHALAICGYDDDRTYTDAAGIAKKGAFKIINSWGSTWNGNGYFWMSYDSFMTDGSSNTSKIDLDPNYQVQAKAKFQISDSDVIYYDQYNKIPLTLTIGVGNPSSPTKSFEPYKGFWTPNWNQAIEVNDGVGYLPPNDTTNKWFIKIADNTAGGATATLNSFSLEYGGNTYSATGLPANIPDNNSSGLIAYIGGSGGNHPPTQPTSVVITPPTPKKTDNLTCTASGSTDADGDTVTYKYAWHLNNVLQSSLTTNTVSNTLLTKGQVWKCLATPNDGKADGTSNQTQTTIVNSSPVLADIPPQTVSEGSPLTFTVSATDPDNDTLTYSATNLPTGATFNTSTKTFSWTPNYIQAGTYPSIQFNASDGTAQSAKTATITVQNANGAPLLNAIPDKLAGTGELLTFQVAATDPDNDTLTYSATNLPTGATFDQTTRTFNWTPATQQTGDHSITFTVSDGSLTDSKTAKITVTTKDDTAISITSPKEGDTLTGQFTITAQIGVGITAAGVTFQIDGETIGQEITSSPYTQSYNTNQKANGKHVLSAIVRKSSGGTVTGKALNVTFANITYSTTDLNRDTKIDLTDFNILKNDFLKLTGSLTNSRSDINADGQATIKDVGILMSGWKP